MPRNEGSAASTEIDANSRESIGFRLTLHIAGPGFADKVTLVGEEMDELEPTFPDVNGLIFERYIGETPEEYVEVRFDYVVSRELERVYPAPKPPEPAPVESEEEAAARPAEERIARTQERH